MIVGLWIGQRGQGAADVGPLPNTRHQIAEKCSGKTNHIKRVIPTLIPTVAPLVQKTLFLLKKYPISEVRC